MYYIITHGSKSPVFKLIINKSPALIEDFMINADLLTVL